MFWLASLTMYRVIHELIHLLCGELLYNYMERESGWDGLVFWIRAESHTYIERASSAQIQTTSSQTWPNFHSTGNDSKTNTLCFPQSSLSTL
jgi:hypothetical protein